MKTANKDVFLVFYVSEERRPVVGFSKHMTYVISDLAQDLNSNDPLVGSFYRRRFCSELSHALSNAYHTNATVEIKLQSYEII